LIRFLLNDKEIATELPPGMVLLDFIRYHQHLPGTKIGCREGDCGACTVLVGEIEGGQLRYESMTCCLMPLANAHGKHIVTIEGINFPNTLNPVQQAMADAGATQCGFCTPGFVISLAGFCLSAMDATARNAIAAVDGNICRCTGYKSIERAAAKVATLLANRGKEEPAVFAAQQTLLPAYFYGIKNKLIELIQKLNLQPTNGNPAHKAPPDRHRGSTHIVGGGTDLYVQKHDEMTHAATRFVFDNPRMNGIRKEGNKCIMGPSATVSDLKNSPVIQQAFPRFDQYAKLVSSTPIRNMATIAGNFINASPIGDFSIFFLALDAQLVLSRSDSASSSATGRRNIPLRKLYKGYKQLDKAADEYISEISFELPGKNSLFHFEKVSKRTYLDIASVNTAIHLKMNGDRIDSASISAGGVAPVPLYLRETSDYLMEKNISEYMVHQAIEIAQSEIAPISDARGTKEYKRLLLGQLIKAHFITLFPRLELGKLIAI
jgi:xanthine dehydrogenase small subunit